MIHGAGGTCIPECELFGVCHCRCGRQTVIARNNQAKDGYVKGMPRSYVMGHAGNRRFDYSMPVQRVLPLVEFLFTEHGSEARVAEVIGVGATAIYRWRKGRVQRVSPSCTRRVVEAVKAHEARLRDEARREYATAERRRYAR